MHRLSGILLDVGAFDLDAECLTLDLDVDMAVECDRLVVLGGLEVLRHVRVEVVLPGHAAPLRDLAVERKPEADRRFDGFAVDDRQGAGQPQTHGTGVGVRLVTELVGATAEHLGGGVQLDVDLEADGRVVLLEYCFVVHVRLPSLPGSAR